MKDNAIYRIAVLDMAAEFISTHTEVTVEMVLIHLRPILSIKPHTSRQWLSHRISLIINS